MKTKITNIRNESGNITTDSSGIEKIKENYEQLYANKFGNWAEIDKFLEGYKLPHLSWRNRLPE